MERDQELREALVAHLERSRLLSSEPVKRALLAVPRHIFLPGVRLEEAYEDRALAIKERGGIVISSISQPAMVAEMLALLDVHAGHAVLEIGTGTGYNAALLAQLAGAQGRVVTVDIEPDLLATASTHLIAAGYASVEVLDARNVASLEGPFDRIIVTARAEDLDAQWWRLLADGGRIVVPLDVGYGGERAIGFRRDGDVLQSYGSHACAFISMRETPSSESTEFFFPNKALRYAGAPSPRAAMSIVAMQRDRAQPSLLDDADVIVARPQTVFSLRFGPNES